MARLNRLMSFDGSYARKLLAAAVCAIAACSAAPAADNTRYVSITGNNANPCTLAQPCRSLQRAISVTPVGGEIRILDSGAYGTNATIKKSLTISGNGNTVSLGSPITVDKANAVVALRGLVLDGQGTIENGIVINAAGAVHIERCVVHGFFINGIRSGADGVELSVLDSISRDNNGPGLLAFGGPRLTIDNSRFENNFAGVRLNVSARAAIHRSTLSGNRLYGISASGSDIAVSIVSTTTANNGGEGFWVGDGATMTLESSLAHGNKTGLFVNGTSGALARISNSTFTNNTTGILNQGTVETRQNNVVRGNTTNVDGTAFTRIGGV